MRILEGHATLLNSRRLIADAVHALTDLVSDILTLATISYSLRPPSTRFPHGYGKVESLGALAVSGILLTGGILIGSQACMALCQQFFPALTHVLEHLPLLGHGHSHSHEASEFGPHINAAWLAAGSIGIKEWLYRSTMKIAKQKRSNVLESNAYHHRVDSLTSIVALVTICASHFLTSARWLDPVGGLLISGMIVQAGWGNTKAALYELADVSIEKEVQDNVSRAARTAVEAWPEADVTGVQGTKSGQNYLIDVEVAAPASWTLHDQTEVETALRKEVVKSVRGVHKVSVRFTVKGNQEIQPFRDQFADDKRDVQAGAEVHEHSHDHHDHDHDHEHEHSHGSKKVDSVLDEKTK